MISQNKQWIPTPNSDGTVQLTATGKGKHGWHQLYLEQVESDTPPQVRLGSNTQFLSMVASKHGWTLIFKRQQPLSNITLKANQPLANRTFSVRSTPSVIAIARMLHSVSERDRLRQRQASRIYRKSWARWRKKGLSGALNRLVREYHPLLAHFHGADDPYPHWLEHVEKPWLEGMAAEQHEKQLSFGIWAIADDTPGEETDGPYNQRLISSLKHQQLSGTYTTQVIPADASANALFEMLNHESLGWITLAPSQVRLAAPALAALTRAIHENPTVGLWYADHDAITDQGDRHSPVFKPDWNPDFYDSKNYLGPMIAVKASLLREALEHLATQTNTPEPLTKKQVNHLIDLCITAAAPNIGHLPWVLSHQPERQLAPEQQLPYYLPEPEGIELAPGNYPGLLPNTQRRVWPLPEPAPLVSLLIPTRDGLDVLATCVDSILAKTDYPNYEIIIIDNQSEQAETLAWFSDVQAQHANVTVVHYDAPFNFSALNNFGARHARGSLLGLVNNDVEVINPGWLTELVRQASRPDVGCVGAKLFYPDDTVQHGGVILGLWGLAGHAHKHFARTDPGYDDRLACTHTVSAVTAACLLVRTEVYQDVGGLEEQLTVAFNDVDFCLKVRALGYRNLWTPWAQLYHYESKSRGAEDTPEKKAREKREIEFMQNRWGEQLERDPFYNPNLTHTGEHFGVRMKILDY